MFFQQAMKPVQLLKVLPHVAECFFIVEVELEKQLFQLAVYKYEEAYFQLKDTRVFQQIHCILEEKQGDEAELLPFIEQALEENMYSVLAEGFIQFDLSVLSLMSSKEPFSLYYYEFIDSFYH